LNCVNHKAVATKGEMLMSTIQMMKSWIGALTELGLMLLALGIVCALLVGGTLPFFGDISKNIVAFVSDLGSKGLVGLIALGLILWLFQHRSVA